MYLKILSRDDKHTNTFMNIQRVEFFYIDGTVDAIKEQINYADLPLVENELAQTDYEASQGIVRVGSFNLTYESGKTQYIIFDGVAFLCNDAGKTVDRYLAN